MGHVVRADTCSNSSNEVKYARNARPLCGRRFLPDTWDQAKSPSQLPVLLCVVYISLRPKCVLRGRHPFPPVRKFLYRKGNE
jgi:hypothetical protein